jgi:hypothetical protein
LVSATRLPLIRFRDRDGSGCDRSDSGYLSPTSIGASPGVAIVIVRWPNWFVASCVPVCAATGTVLDLEHSVSRDTDEHDISGG